VASLNPIATIEAQHQPCVWGEVWNEKFKSCDVFGAHHKNLVPDNDDHGSGGALARGQDQRGRDQHSRADRLPVDVEHLHSPTTQSSDAALRGQVGGMRDRAGSGIDSQKQAWGGARAGV